jgi:hypothetical protein
MKTLTHIRRALGIDTRGSEYSYGYDPKFGHVAASRVAHMGQDHLWLLFSRMRQSAYAATLTIQ